jgi:hypothetical protein
MHELATSLNGSGAAMARKSASKSHDTGAISIGGNVVGSAFSTGQHNRQNVTHTTEASPDVIDALREIKMYLEALTGPRSNAAKVYATTAIKAASAKKPSKDKVGAALNSAFRAAKKSPEFAGAASRLAPYLRTAVGWLGGQWPQVLGL